MLTRFIINDFETNRNENTIYQKINRNERFRKKRAGFCQISVSNTSCRLQLSAVIQTTRTGTTLCKLVETWIFLLPRKCTNIYAKHTACDNVRTVWFHPGISRNS